MLAQLGRGELHQPLRSMTRAPDGASLMGLMPGYRGGQDAAWYALKEIVVVPDNPTRGLDPHQGAVLLHDGATGELRAVLNASPITEIRTAAVSGVASRALARPGAAVVAVLGGGIQARSHAAAMQAVFPEAGATAPGTPRLSTATTPGGRSRVGADVVCTCTSAREPILRRDWLATGAHVNAVGSSIPTARELDTDTMTAATIFVDRRESALNEAGDLLLAGHGGDGPDRSRPRSARCSSAHIRAAPPTTS